MAAPPTMDSLLGALDDGERAAIALALSLQADLLLIDERRGAVARRKGLPITGTLGILVLAAEQCLIDLADAFARLRRTRFHHSESLLQKILAKQQGEGEP